MDTRVYWIWMQQALGAGNPAAGRLLSLFETPAQVYAASPEERAQAGVSKSVLERLKNRSLETARAILEQVLQREQWLLTPDDALYPALLRGLPDLPLVLYGQGQTLDLDWMPAVAMIGTRSASAYGRAMAHRMAASLAAGGMTVVSGGAVGIDAACLQAAMEAGGTVVSVQACGLDVNYPAENAGMRRRILETDGMLVSEYPPGTPVTPGCFPIRNRLMSGMTLGTCVIEAPERSGALITARLACEQGRDVFAIPGAITSPKSGGANELIKRGARLVSDACEIIGEYQPLYASILDIEAAADMQDRIRREDGKFPESAPETKPRRKRPAPAKEPMRTQTKQAVAVPEGASPLAKRIFEALTEEPQHIDVLAQNMALPTEQVLAGLTELELFGAAQSYAGRLYSR